MPAPARRPRAPKIPATKLAAATAVAGLGCLVAGTGVAWAHAEVVSTYPAATTTPGRLTHISVRFDEAVKIVPRALVLTTDLGVPVDLDPPRLIGGVVLRADLQDAVSPGRYVVGWRVEADDDHIESGTFRFRVHAATAVRMPTGPGAGNNPVGDPGDPVWPVLVAAGIAVAAGAGAAVVVRRGLRSLAPADPLYPSEFHTPVPPNDHAASRE